MGSTGNDDDDEAWDWVLSPRADDQFVQLDDETQDRIASKLDDVVSSEWREPEDFLESLTGSPFQKLRVGGYRVGCRIKHDERVLRVESIRKREGAYSGDDD
jgi:mRNA-degrading endonuclease RelE of RelBE toxin-antitoxin system